MGRLRKTLHWMVPIVGGTSASPIRRESSAEIAARESAELLKEHNGLLEEQNRLLTRSQPVRGQYKFSEREPEEREFAPCAHCGTDVRLVAGRFPVERNGYAHRCSG